jgi:high affinity Mn2+ porin
MDRGHLVEFGSTGLQKLIYPIWYLSEVSSAVWQGMLHKTTINYAIRRLYPTQYIVIEWLTRSRRGVDHPARLFLARLTFVYAVALSTSPSPGFAHETAPPTAQPPTSGAEEIAPAPEENAPENFSIHGQFTNVTQYHPPFTSPFYGPNSLIPGHRGNETIDLTLFAGLRLWDGLEAYVNPEVDQGFGLSNTLGVAGFPSGEAYKIGMADPYLRLPRTFFRYTLGLGGAEQTIEPGLNQLAGTRQADNLIFTVGKFSVVDIFDTKTYAHDPRSDFLNWSIIDAGAFDYAADAWGYTYGGTVEWTQSWWTLRQGVFNLSRVPNSKYLDRDFVQFEVATEAEGRHELFGQPGKLKFLFWMNRGHMANYNAAVAMGQATGATPDVAKVRRYSSRPGVALNLEQQIAPDLGVFARASADNGSKEVYEFTEINQSISAGMSMKGERWRRPDDTFGLAGVVNGISPQARNYFAAGGLGVLIGDGQLPRYGLERILEVYYKASIIEGLNLTFDYQHIANPAYDAVRGPVDIFGFRVHAEF